MHQADQGFEAEGTRTKTIIAGSGAAKFSVTSLMTYEACPFQYFSTYVCHIPPLVTPAMRSGSAIHKLIADHLMRPQLIPPDVDSKTLELLETFRSSRFNVPPVDTERSFSLPFDKGDVRGRIDLVLRRADNSLELVDFKSGAGAGREDMLGTLQLPLYALAACSDFKEPIDRISYSYFFLRDGSELSARMSMSAASEVRRRVDTIMQGVDEQRFDPAPGCRCFACRRSGLRAK